MTKSSACKGLDVFDFNEEDELPEIASRRVLGKFKNPSAESSPLMKYKLLEFAAHGSNGPAKEDGDGLCTPCVDVDAIDNAVSCSPLSAAGEDADTKVTFGFGAVLQSSCRNHEHSHCTIDNHERESIFSGLERKASSPGAPVAGSSQLDCLLPESPCSNEPEPVDTSTNTDGSMKESSPSTPASDIAEDSVSSDGHALDERFGAWGEDDNMAVVVCPDYIVYRDRYCTASLLSFSSSCIKIKGSIAHGTQGINDCQWDIHDVVGIESQWFGRVETAIVKLHVISKDVAQDDNADGTSGIEELKFAVVDPNWSGKQEAIISLDLRYKAVWNVVLDADGVGNEDAVLGQKNVFCPKRYFPIYLKNKIPPEEKHRFHFFNSFFFRKLADLDKDPSSASDGRAAFLRVRKWTRKVNLFGKDFIFIPVNFNLHWSLIVICHPGEVTNFKDEDIFRSLKVPCILHMDSIKGSHMSVKNIIQSYLWEEWKERQKDTSEDISSKFLNLRFVSLELPQQENSFDCGLFLLHYAERFLDEAPASFSPFKLTKFSSFLNVNWFPPSEASLKRVLIQRLIYDILENRSQETSPRGCSNEQWLKFQENKIENGAGVEFVEERFSPAKACHGNLSSSQTGQGIEITLLATSSVRNSQCVGDSGLVLREFFEPGAAAGSFLDGRYQSFEPTASFHRLNDAMAPVMEETAAGEQLLYPPVGETGYQRLGGIPHDDCSLAYSCGDFRGEPLWNPGISMQLPEHEHEHELAASSPETLSCSSEDSLEMGFNKISPTGGDKGLNHKGEDRSTSPSTENIVCSTQHIASGSSGIEEIAVKDTQDHDKLPACDENGESRSCRTTIMSFTIKDSDMEENQDGACDEAQLVGDDTLSESEQRAAKKLRLTPPSEEEGRHTGTLLKDLHL
ncbi:probable ubiquitin-like-specific protease 2B isoform X2 [Malania oleifera]|uniref:probable ubiquitin-like-specific protease 2B isoform X2 n=1 Tax=Malania oleifera TaxID=397392 RepID=UPI0025AE0F00|nr:probable ubiquitin-like-specific protease 2B isoform X2 [Malania oleifera]